MAKKVKNEAFDESVDSSNLNTEESAEKELKKGKKGKKGVDPNATPADPSKYKYVVKNKKARREIKERKAVIIIAIILACLLLIGGLIYGFYGAVRINNYSIYVQQEGSKILSLSPTENFLPGTQMLEIEGPDTMDNTSLFKSPHMDTPIQDKLLDIVSGEGQQSSKEDKFIAATFFLKNTTSDVQYYNEFLRMTQATKDLDTALRVMLVKNYEISVYAHLDKNGNPERVVPTNEIYAPISITSDSEGKLSIVQEKSNEAWLATPFYDEEYVFYNKGFMLNPGDMVKYSIIIWLEGWDPECVNDILGGVLRIEFAFETIPKPATE